MAIRRILLIAEDPVYRESLVQVLASRGHSVVPMTHLVHVFDVATAVRPALILMDYGVGESSLLEAIRTDPVTAVLPLILLATDPAVGSAAPTVLVKPVTDEALLEAVTRCLAAIE